MKKRVSIDFSKQRDDRGCFGKSKVLITSCYKCTPTINLFCAYVRIQGYLFSIS